jgi:hypothetical protein
MEQSKQHKDIATAQHCKEHKRRIEDTFPEGLDCKGWEKQHPVYQQLLIESLRYDLGVLVNGDEKLEDHIKAKGYDGVTALSCTIDSQIQRTKKSTESASGSEKKNRFATKKTGVPKFETCKTCGKKHKGTCLFAPKNNNSNNNNEQRKCCYACCFIVQRITIMIVLQGPVEVNY